MSQSQINYLWNVHCAKMRKQKLTPLTHRRFTEIIHSLGF